MSFTTKFTARRAALTLKDKIKNPNGWKIRVWENGGNWHFELLKGPLSLHASGEEIWSLFSLNYPGAGDPTFSTDYRSKNPNKVIANQMAVVVREFKRLAKGIDQVEK